MNRIVIRNILISVILIISVILVLLYKGRSPFGNRQSSFAIDKQKEITRIAFSEGNKELILTHEADKWMVNGTWEARKSGITFITGILKEMKIKSPVSGELFETEILEKGITPVKIKIFENSRLLSSFLVFKTGSNKYGNMMKLRERTKPFIVAVPGLEGDIGSAFTVNELFWQPFTIYNLLPSEISSVTFENLKDSGSSFRIKCINDTYIFSASGEILAGWDSARVKRYISYFTWIPFEKWAYDISAAERKKIESGNPVFRISVIKTDGKEKVLTMWERRAGEEGAIDSDRMWAKTNEREELFIVRFFDIDPLLKKRSYFFPE
jgi:hypothetical protein